ncbi:GNAT family N-acetyltransferase [Leifsonia shinshuensis]|uniref:GNAT family N-acetyltransferase n=1 Tax=Leifsonia shinshuensis TaxID=150026 RepID=UPI00285D923B|nr:GNAT family N-acetyltransferase [Leifsonia shinshuensis]MDR6971815.1 putative acetyltransferase [Leifsonia shinshuensis]
MPIDVRVEPPRQPEVEDLLRLSDEYAFSLYPAESCYLLDVSELERQGVTVFVARVDGRALGIAALVVGDASDRAAPRAELKRMFVHEDARGRGLARLLLSAIERAAADAGVAELRLETGPLQHAAIALYERSGYARIPNFGPYVGDPYSVCYAKALPVPAS